MSTDHPTSSLGWLDPVAPEPPAIAPDEAATYLRERLGETAYLADDPSVVTAVVGGNQLALTLAAAAMRERGLKGQQYRDRFTATGDAANGRPAPDPVATAFRIAVELADDGRFPGMPRALLSVASLLGPHGIASDIFRSASVITYLRDVLERDVRVADVDDGLVALHRLSLAHVRLAGPHRVVFVPGQVLRAALRGVTSAELAQLARICADALERCWPAIIADIDLDLLRALRSAHALRRYAGSHLLTRETGCHPVLVLAGQSIGDAGLPTDARVYYRDLAERAACVLGADHPDTLRTRSRAASWLGMTHDWRGSLAEFTELLDDFQRVLGDGHPDTLVARASHATYLARTGEVAAAVSELEKVLQARMSLLGPYHLDTLVTRARLANWRGRAGQVHEAVAELESVLADFQEHQPGQARHISRTRGSLATWRGQAGDAAAAVAGHRANLEEMLRTYGTDNPDTLVSRKTLAYWYEMVGEHVAAGKARAQLNAQRLGVMERYEDIVGAGHPDLRLLKATLAEGASTRRARTASVDDLRALLAEQQEIAGPLHPDTLAIRTELASLIGRANDPAAAVAELRSLLERAESALGPRNPEILKTLARMASWQGRAGDPAGAVQTLQDLLDRQVEALGPRHHHVRTTLSSLAAQHSACRNQIAAGETLAALLAHQRRRPRASEHEILRTWQRVVLWRAECGQTKTVVQQLRQIVDRLSAVAGHWHPDTFEARFQAARWMWKTGQRERAEGELDRLLQVQTTHLGRQHRQVARSRNLLKQWRENPGPVRPPVRLVLRGMAAQAPRGADTWDQPVGTLARLVHCSRAAGPLLETLALCSACSAEPVTRRTWLVLANALSATAPIAAADVEKMLTNARPFVMTEHRGDDIAYRVDAALGRRVLTRAAGRTGLGSLDAALRQRTLTRALLAQLTPESSVRAYAARNLPRHAAAGACLDWLTRPEILDHLDMQMVTEVAWQAWASGTPLPSELSDVLQIRHLLAGASPADRATVRGTMSAQRAQQPAARAATWTVAWSRVSSVPPHLTLVSPPGETPWRDDPQGGGDEIRALACLHRRERTLVIVGRRSGELEVWDTRTGRREPASMRGPANLTTLDVAVVGDIQVLAAVGDRHAWLWNLADESLWDDRLPEPEGGIGAAGFVRHGEHVSVLAVAEARGHITLWDPAAGQVIDRSIARLDDPASGICAFASLRRQGECVAVASGHQVTTWETAPLRLTDVTVPAGHGAVTSVASVVSHGSTRLWVGDEDGCIAVHDPHTGQRHDLARAHDGPVPALATIQLTDTRSLVASGGADGTIRLWDPQPGDGAGLTSAGSLPGHGAGVHALALPRQGGPQRLASAGADKTVRLWNLKRLTTQLTEPAGPEHPVTAIVTTGREKERNRCLVTGHRNGMLQRHDLATGERIGDPVCEHPSPIQMMAEVPVPGGRPRVATIDSDNTVRLWDLGSSARPVPPEMPAPPEMIAELPCLDARAIAAVERGDDTLVAVGGSTGLVRLWGVRNHGSPGSSRLIRAHAGAVTSMLFGRLSDGAPWLVTAGSDHTIRSWTVRRDDTLPCLIADGPAVELGSVVTTMAILPTGHGPVVAADGEDGSVRLLDIADGRVLTTIQAGDDTAPVAELHGVRAADGRWLLLGIGRMGTLDLWRPDTGQHVHRLHLDGPIKASHSFGSDLAIATRRGLSLLTLTLADPEGMSIDAEPSGGADDLARQGQQGGGWS
jgi:WD40 repeat protein